MIHIFLGTKAQLIKMAPVMVELQNRNIPYNFIFSGQHQATVANIREEFGLKDPDITLYEGRDITGILQMLLWSIRIVFFTLWNRDKVWQGDKGGVVLNHGDTFSTLLGSVLARISGQKSAHVESGLRSFEIFAPFPEEVTRLATFGVSNIYFAPGEWALGNLEKYKGEKINTIHNTLLDSLRICHQSVTAAEVDIPQEKFAVVSLHRFENIFSRQKLEQLTDLLTEVSDQIPILFILHKPTEEKLIEFGLLDKLSENPRIDLRPRYTYFQFIKLVKATAVVLTDGGSNQEECFYLGKPCVILRNTSERKEGLEKNAIISRLNREIIIKFIEELDLKTYTPPPFSESPSRTIVDYLVKQHFESLRGE